MCADKILGAIASANRTAREAVLCGGGQWGRVLCRWNAKRKDIYLGGMLNLAVAVALADSGEVSVGHPVQQL